MPGTEGTQMPRSTSRKRNPHIKKTRLMVKVSSENGRSRRKEEETLVA